MARWSAGQGLLEGTLLTTQMARFQPAAEILRMGFAQLSKPIARRTALPQLNRTASPLQRSPRMLWLGLQQRGIGLLSRFELVLLKQLVSGGAGGCGRLLKHGLQQ
jgi:hypothetical protein